MTRLSLKLCLGIVGLGISFAATAPLKAAPSFPWDPKDQPPNDSSQTVNDSHTVEVKAGEIVKDINFGNTPSGVGEIWGTKWNDLNGDGIRQKDEPGLPNVRIYLDLNKNRQFDDGEPSQITDTQGQYKLTNLAPGTYVVREVVPKGYKQTFPNAAKK